MRLWRHRALQEQYAPQEEGGLFACEELDLQRPGSIRIVQRAFRSDGMTCGNIGREREALLFRKRWESRSGVWICQERGHLLKLEQVSSP